MPSHANRGQWAEAEAQRLLAVFTIQPPPDFAAQVLARVQQASQDSPPPLVSQRPALSPAPAFQDVGKAWYCYSGTRWAIACMLLATSAVALWRTWQPAAPPVTAVETALPVYTTAQPALTPPHSTASVGAPGLSELPVPQSDAALQESPPLDHLSDPLFSLEALMTFSLPVVPHEALQMAENRAKTDGPHNVRSKHRRAAKSPRPHKS
ncbi:MAG: hypothetical protein AB7N91_01745 [Candidatus Tectimicrobiota bacterium]